ncbi:hypothetical protein [Spiroplasma endosymbiont of Amphimallon solstitiale]|uniref:hypothetical protein n=1 Tax=Spiroplasma endosymbiont of Amphimallon solstitiale TaxID=3066288 RepID=UPI00313E257C
MKHNFKEQRYFCSYCEKFRMKHLFYFKNIFLQDKNNKVICIYCWKLGLHLKEIWYEKEERKY